MNQRARLRWLERLFIAEYSGRLPFQSRSKAMAELVVTGHIEPLTRRHLADRFGIVEVRGYILTDKGRMEYCAYCASLPEVMDAD